MKFVRDSAERLRVSQEKKASGYKGLSDAANDGSRNVNREVHRHVAAENSVETIALPKQRVVLDQVSFLKSDRRPHGLVQLKVAAVAAKILRLQIIDSLPDRPRAIPSLLAFSSPLRITI